MVTKTNGLRRDLGKNRLGPFSDGALCVWEDSALSIVFDVKKPLCKGKPCKTRVTEWIRNGATPIRSFVIETNLLRDPGFSKID